MPRILISVPVNAWNNDRVEYVLPDVPVPVAEHIAMALAGAKVVQRKSVDASSDDHVFVADATRAVTVAFTDATVMTARQHASAVAQRKADKAREEAEAAEKARTEAEREEDEAVTAK
jgi:hypothetical protein